MDCLLVPNDGPKYKFKCSECGTLYERELHSNCPKHNHQTREQTPLPCVHRGPAADKQTAKRCCGQHYEIDSFFCRKHGQCALYPYTPLDGEQAVTICATCPDISTEAKLPSLIERAGNFTDAMMQHMAAGFPQCTAEQVQERWNHCERCEFRENNNCKLCGCFIANVPNSSNKLAWAEQSCPHNPPFWGSLV